MHVFLPTGNKNLSQLQDSDTLIVALTPGEHVDTNTGPRLVHRQTQFVVDVECHSTMQFTDAQGERKEQNVSMDFDVGIEVAVARPPQFRTAVEEELISVELREPTAYQPDIVTASDAEGDNLAIVKTPAEITVAEEVTSLGEIAAYEVGTEAVSVASENSMDMSPRSSLSKTVFIEQLGASAEESTDVGHTPPHSDER